MHSMRKVFGLLLGFATLPEKSRRDFLTKLNEFMMMSPPQKRRATSEWRQAVDEGSGEPDEPAGKR
ncbi:hypothetical protein WS93_02985 [Burkholderia cepacia]|uniref:Uncharacterized protein n=2 Tax=Burkholderia cepacia TaxID=292 RepID=A0A124SQ01_BURCE|nr:hypothetical protein WS90_00065 [Burkholderia cepacia]KVL06113.1 hypothetical protein WS93_02985 [Burkholderia cepacia]